MVPFQTLSEFVENPFGISDTKKRNTLEEKYVKMKSNSKFKVEGFTTIDDDYLIHVVVPSDSNSNQSYDVVVLFFTDDTVVKKRTTFSNYYVKFFSNSPSFIYQYAYLYRENGFLIDFLYDKLDDNFSSQAPTKSNKNMDLFYDKSIYCASRLILDNGGILLSKLGIITKHKKNKDKFFRDIKSFENIKMTSELKSIDKKINKELEENKKIKRKEKPKQKARSSNKIMAKSNTLSKNSKPGITKVKKKTGNKKVVSRRK